MCSSDLPNVKASVRSSRWIPLSMGLIFAPIASIALIAQVANKSPIAPPQTDRDDIRTVFFVRDPSGAQLREITRLVDQGKLRPQVGAVYPLADAREAFMAKSTQHIPGKVVLTP